MPETITATPSAIEVMRQFSVAEGPRVQADLEAEAANRARLFSMPAELVEAPSVTICSVWPERLESQPFHHGGIGRKIYHIEAGSPENPAYLSVKNTWDWTIVQEGVGERGDRQAPVMAGMLAMDLIRFWTGDHPGNKRGKKGIGIIVGEYNHHNRRQEATKQEIEALAFHQKGFLTYLVERADQLWDKGAREMISGEHRKALQMLGLDLNMHPWYRSKVQLYNACPACAEKVLIEARVCRHCHTDLVDFFLADGVTPDAAEWPNVVKAMERRNKAKGKKE